MRPLGVQIMKRMTGQLNLFHCCVGNVRVVHGIDSGTEIERKKIEKFLIYKVFQILI